MASWARTWVGECPEADPMGGGGARWARALPSKVSTLFFCCMAFSARFTFDQRTVYVLSTARVTRSVSSQAHAVCVTAGIY